MYCVLDVINTINFKKCSVFKVISLYSRNFIERDLFLWMHSNVKS